MTIHFLVNIFSGVTGFLFGAPVVIVVLGGIARRINEYSRLSDSVSAMRTSVQDLTYQLRGRNVVYGDPLVWWINTVDSFVNRFASRPQPHFDVHRWAEHIKEAEECLPAVDLAVAGVMSVANERDDVPVITRLRQLHGAIRRAQVDERFAALNIARAAYEASARSKLERRFEYLPEVKAQVEALYRMLCEMSVEASRLVLEIETHPALA